MWTVVLCIFKVVYKNRCSFLNWKAGGRNIIKDEKKKKEMISLGPNSVSWQFTPDLSKQFSGNLGQTQPNLAASGSDAAQVSIWVYAQLPVAGCCCLWKPADYWLRWRGWHSSLGILQASPDSFIGRLRVPRAEKWKEWKPPGLVKFKLGNHMSPSSYSMVKAERDPWGGGNRRLQFPVNEAVEY